MQKNVKFRMMEFQKPQISTQQCGGAKALRGVVCGLRVKIEQLAYLEKYKKLKNVICK